MHLQSMHGLSPLKTNLFYSNSSLSAVLADLGAATFSATQAELNAASLLKFHPQVPCWFRLAVLGQAAPLCSASDPNRFWPGGKQLNTCSCTKRSRSRNSPFSKLAVLVWCTPDVKPVCSSIRAYLPLLSIGHPTAVKPVQRGWMRRFLRGCRAGGKKAD